MENRIILENEERNYRAEILEIIRSSLSDEEIRSRLDEYHDNDIASVFDELDSSERERLRSALGVEAISEVLSYAEEAGEYLSELESAEAADIIEKMDADDALELLDSLDEETKSELLMLVEDEIKEDIELIDSYEDDEFGSRMSTNYISVPKASTIKKAMRALVSNAAEKDNISTIFVHNEDGSFYGAIELKSLIIARSDDSFEELIYTNFPYVYDTDSVSMNAEVVRSYSEDIIPVISKRDKSILGVITASDITEIVDDERGDDYAKLAALTSEEERGEGFFKSVKKRIPWLVALLFMGLLVSFVVGIFEGVVKELPLIVCFQSLILGMAGNVGTQSLAVTVRSLGSYELNAKKRILLILKETRVAFLNGFLLSLVSFGVVSLYLVIVGSYTSSVILLTALCVSLALLFAMTVSGFVGAFIPISFDRFGIDPAVASGPLITTVNDLVAVLSYYGLAWLLFLSLI